MDNERTAFAVAVGQLIDRLEAPGGDPVVVRWTDGRTEGVGGPAWDHSLERMLVRSAGAGDDEALELLLRHEWYGVFQLVSEYEPDPGKAEELVQEVFTRVIAALGQVHDLGVPFRSHVAQVARRLLRDARVRPVAPPQPEPPGARAATQAPDPAAAAGCRRPTVVVLPADDRPQFLAALDRLPRQSRELLRLRFVEGRTEREIGIEWGRTTECVLALERQALAALLDEDRGEHG